MSLISRINGRTLSRNSLLQPDLAKATLISGQPFFGRLRSRLSSGTDGGALVEMAVTLPIVFLVMTGIFNFSIVLYQKLELEEAVASGARVLAVARGDTDPCQTSATAIYAAAPTLAPANITLTFVVNGVSTGASCPGPSNTANANMQSGANAGITASYPCTLKWFGGSLPSCKLSTELTEVIQ